MNELEQFYADVAETANMEIGYWTSKPATTEEARKGINMILAEIRDYQCPNWEVGQEVKRGHITRDAGYIDATAADVVIQYARFGEAVYG